MLRNLKDRLRPEKKLFFKMLPLFAAILIFVNSTVVRSVFFGLVASFLFLVLGGFFLGRVFFDDEPSFLRVTLGTLAFVVLLSFVELLAITIFQVEIWYLFGVAFAAAVVVTINLVKPRDSKVGRSSGDEKKDSLSKVFRFQLSRVSFFKFALVGLYVCSFAFSFRMLLDARSGWFASPPWKVLPSYFLLAYLAATFLLIAVALLVRKPALTMLLVGVHCVLSLSFIYIVSYPGIALYDPWVELGRAQVLLPGADILGDFRLDFLRNLNYYMRGLSVHVLMAALSGMLTVDLYWTYVTLIPVLWGFFGPAVAYAVTKRIGGDEWACALAAVLTLGSSTLVYWGILTEANSFGNLVFFMFVYLLLKFLSPSGKRLFFLLIVTLGTVVFAHPVPTVLSFSLVILAFSMKKYGIHSSKPSKSTYLTLFVAFVASMFFMPFFLVGRGVILPVHGTPMFSVSRLLETDVWTLIFGFSNNLPLKEVLILELLPLFALIGFAYVLKNRSKFNGRLCFFLFLGLLVILIDYRIMEYAMIYRPFGPSRVYFHRDVFSLPFAGIVLGAVLSFLGGTLSGTLSKIKCALTARNIFAAFFISICVSSLAAVTVYETYAHPYLRGLLPTSLEVEAIEYIIAHTDKRYVVVSDPETRMVGWGLVGPEVPGKEYRANRDLTSNPSLDSLLEIMTRFEADIGYLVVSSFRTAGFDKAVAKASQEFALFKTFSNEKGEMYVFHYKVPPSPISADIEAFYWDTPPSYIIQNDLMRVVLNLASMNLEVRDFWRGLYESIDLNETLAGGASLGNLLSVEYFNSTSDTWVTWNPEDPTPYSPALAEQFQFKLRLENDSLIGVVRSGNSSLSLWSESTRALTLSLQAGEFTRIYIPGLIGGEDAYNVSSRDFGLLYTLSRTENVVLHPASKYEIETTSLIYGQVAGDCNLAITKGYLSYDLYVENKDDLGQWAYVEVWLPDVVYGGSFPPISYSIDDGETWSDSLPYTDFPRGVPVITAGGSEVNWIFSKLQNASTSPSWWRSFSNALGGTPSLPESFTDSGGARNRIIFGVYLPAGDKALLRLGASIYGARPLKVTYNFRDSFHSAYGLRNMERGLVKVYNYGTSQHVGGIALADKPTSLAITEDESGKIDSISVTIPANVTFSLLSASDVNTAIDIDRNGVPDAIE